MKTWLKLAIAILVYNSIFICFCLYKYFHYLYNGLDLAIYTNVLHNIINGNGAWSSIQMQNYFGDHFEPFLFIISIFYSLFQSPITLLVIQTIVISLSVIPIYFISKKYFDEKKSFLVSVVWLLIPLLHNINSFEFHILSFAIPLIAWTYYAYQKNNFSLFCIIAILSLLVREDVALVIMMFGVLSWIDKKALRWKVFPAVMGFLYFLTTTYFIGRLSDSGSYKFLAYYGWIQANTPPWEIIIHIFNPANILFVFVLLCIFIFLPIFKLRTLILIIPIIFQIILQGTNHTWIVLTTHYTSLLLPVFFIASIQGYSSIIKDDKNIFSRFFGQHKELLPVLIGATIVYTTMVIGPFLGLIKPVYDIKTQIYNELLSSIEKNTGKTINATLAVLPLYANTENTYSHHYTFLGRSQFGAREYKIPSTPDYHIIDFDDYFYYQNNFKYNPVVERYWSEATSNIKNVLDPKNYSIENCINSLCVFKKGGSYEMSRFYEKSDFTSKKDFEVTLAEQNKNNQFIDIKIKYQQKNVDNKMLFAKFSYEKNGQKIYETLIPVNYGFKNSDEWEARSAYINSYHLFVPDPSIIIRMQVITARGYETIGSMRETIHKLNKEKILYETILKN